MNPKIYDFVTTGLLVFPGVLIFIEVFLRLPIIDHLARIQTLSLKSVHIIRSPLITDNWKEKILPRYAWRILTSCLLSMLLLIFLLCLFSLAYILCSLILTHDIQASVYSLITVKVQVCTLIVGMVYGVIRKQAAGDASSPGEYSPGSKLLHYVALNNSAIREAAFDIDCILSPKQTENSCLPGPNVYISGLARAGTTILLEALYSTGQFVTLTYREMPFVTAPNLWKKISKSSKIQANLKERAHGDRLLVGFDSPEAFEEVFWKTFSEQYIQKDHIEFQKKTDKDLTQKYRQYVANILASQGQTENDGLRYLAKNNNNLLRIPLIKEAFPDSIIIVPFRNPFDHAGSLLKQHHRFLETHEKDSFSLKYMNWLGHHEFGMNMKPFYTCDEILSENNEDPLSIKFWLRYWASVYNYLIRHHGSEVMFFDYDQFCTTPEHSFEALSHHFGVDSDALKKFAGKVKAPKPYQTEHYFSNSGTDIFAVHEKLKSLAVNRIKKPDIESSSYK